MHYVYYIALHLHITIVNRLHCIAINYTALTYKELLHAKTTNHHFQYSCRPLYSTVQNSTEHYSTVQFDVKYSARVQYSTS